jgi:hypothetical protein
MTTDVHDRRKRNLKLLVQQWDGPTNLAKKLGYAGPSYVSQMVSGNRPITEKAARQIEDKASLPTGWLDQDNRPPGKNGRPAAVDTDLISRIITTIGTVLEEEGVQLHPSKFSELVALVYEDAATHGRTDDAFVSRLVRLLK